MYRYINRTISETGSKCSVHHKYAQMKFCMNAYIHIFKVNATLEVDICVRTFNFFSLTDLKRTWHNFSAQKTIYSIQVGGGGHLSHSDSSCSILYVVLFSR